MSLGITSDSGTPINPELYSCPICHDKGFFVYDLPVDDKNFGKPFPCGCQEDKRRERRENRVRSMSALGAFAGQTFASFNPVRPGLSDEHNSGLSTAFAQARAYAEQPHGWLLLTGSYGTGKTHLAAAIANHRLLETGEAVIMVTVPDLLEHLRATYGPNSDVAYDEVFDQLRNAALLVLDDLGAESSTAWAQEKLYVLFNHRHVRRLPTVITTNQDVDLMDGRIRSRLLDDRLTQVLPLTVPDHRSPATALEADLYDMSRYYAMTFERFEDRRGELNEEEQGRMDRLITAAHGFAEHPAGWLVLISPPSTGKTHLAAGIAHERRNLGDKVIMTTCAELIDYLRASFGSPVALKLSKRMQELKSVPLLVLDNLVIDDNTSAWVRERLHEILIYRFDQNLATVITMYQGAEVTDPRIASRIENKSRCTVPNMRLPAYKGGAAPRRAQRPTRR